ncbi:MAG TPA: hypothetical protein VMR62_05380 [Bryobacteraceae bacterium]|jgi:uncharacterized protein YndB with AHSA1/START domain|nr:hypothetical protein [Bryobacteraceae bacterium]
MKLIDITVARAIPAAAEKVFDVWMDRQSLGGPWFGGAHLAALRPLHFPRTPS